jgi:hypothetical protein
MTDVDETTDTGNSRRSSWTTVILLVVVAVLAGVLLALAQADRKGNGASVATSKTSAESTSASVTSVRNDALADYEAALKTGKPIYVLFHSLT